MGPRARPYCDMSHRLVGPDTSKIEQNRPGALGPSLAKMVHVRAKLVTTSRFVSDSHNRNRTAKTNVSVMTDGGFDVTGAPARGRHRTKEEATDACPASAVADPPGCPQRRQRTSQRFDTATRGLGHDRPARPGGSGQGWPDREGSRRRGSAGNSHQQSRARLRGQARTRTAGEGSDRAGGGQPGQARDRDRALGRHHDVRAGPVPARRPRTDDRDQLAAGDEPVQQRTADQRFATRRSS